MIAHTEDFTIKKMCFLARGGNLKNCSGDHNLLGGGQNVVIFTPASPEAPDKCILKCT